MGRRGSGIQVNFYQIRLVRTGEKSLDLGTVPNEDYLETWFSGAFAAGLLPDPPKYTDEIQVFEISTMDSIHDPGILRKLPLQEVQSETLKWVWRLSWHQFSVQPKLVLV